MTWTLVQKSAAEDKTTTGTTTPTLPAGSTAGNLLVACVGSATGGTAFTAPANWVQGPVVANGGTDRTEIWYYPANPGGISSAAFVSGISTVRGNLAEFHTDVMNAVVTVEASGTGTAGAVTTCTATATGANTAGDLGICSFLWKSTVASVVVFTDPANFTLIADDLVSANTHGYGGYNLSQASGTAAPVLTVDVAPAVWTGVVALFIATPGAGPPPQRITPPPLASTVPWLQKDRRDANTVATAANPLVPPLDTAWQADAQYSHLFNDAHLRDRRQYFTQRPLVSDPNLLISPGTLDPTTDGQDDLGRRQRQPATHAPRWWMPQQRASVPPAIPPLYGRGATTAGTGTSTALLTYTIANPSWNPLTSTSYPGDICLLWVTLRGATVLNVPAGFTAVTASVLSASQYQLFYRVTDGSEGATFTISWASGGNTSQAVANSYPGMDTVQILDPVPSASGIAGLAGASITTTHDGDVLVWLAACKTTSAGQVPGLFTPPAGFYTEIAQQSTVTTADPNVSAFLADMQQASRGATGTLTGTSSSATESDAVLVVALSPAPVLSQPFQTAAFLPPRQAFPQQRPLVSDPNLLVPAGTGTDPTTSGWGSGSVYWHLYNDAADAAPRSWAAQQPRSADPSLLATAELENELLGGAQTARTYNTPATNTARWWMPEQPARNADPLLIQTALLEGVLLGGADTARHAQAAAWTDRREVPQQRPYVSDPLLLSTALLENELLGGADVMRHCLPAAYWDRRLMPQQRPYVSDPLLLGTAQLENELLGGGDTARHAMWFTDRRLIPQQRAYLSDPLLLTTALLENELLGAGDTARHSMWFTDRRLVPQQRPYLSDSSLLIPPGPLDPTVGAWLPAWLNANRAATHTDRRLLPQQRPYISDPSFYPSGAVTDPLTLAWGADGPYWHMYNRAATITERRLVPQQRLYQSDPLLLTTALLENELLGAADMQRHMAATYYDRREVPQQRAYVSDPLLLTTALLENELLGGGGTWLRYSTPAYFRPLPLPQQRQYPDLSSPAGPVTDVPYLSDGGRHAAWYTDRREVPQQRPYVSDPLLLTTAQLENELLGGAETWQQYNVPAFIRPAGPPQQRPYRSDPLLLGVPADPTLLAYAEIARRYGLPFTHADRRLVPQQRTYWPVPPPPPTVVPGEATPSVSGGPNLAVVGAQGSGWAQPQSSRNTATGDSVGAGGVSVTPAVTKPGTATPSVGG